MTEDSKLHEVVEQIRQEEFPDIAPELVRELLDTHLHHQDDPAQAHKETHQLIRRHASPDSTTDES